MEREIELGSEYNLTLSNLNIADKNLFYYLKNKNYGLLDSGRSAIKCICLPAGKILLPEFICESVIRCFPKDALIFYKVKSNFIIDLEDLKSKITKSVSVLFFAHYFGMCQPEYIRRNIRKIANENGILLIEDATQSLFSVKSLTGDFLIASIRKWFPIPNGGLLIYAAKNFPTNLCSLKKSCDNKRAYGMVLKDLYLQGKMDCNMVYRKIFAECESRLDSEKEIYGISDFSKYILSCVDVNDIIFKREKNYKKLRDGLDGLQIVPAISLDVDECPFVFLLRIPDRDKFRNYLIDHRIYCAVHWPFDGLCSAERSQAKKFGDELISLPIDQRYENRHIEYLISVIKKYKSKGGKLLY